MGVCAAGKVRTAGAWLVGTAAWLCAIATPAAQEEAPTEQAPTEQAPTEQAPTEQAPTEQAPTEEGAPTGLDRMPAGDWSRPSKPTKPSDGYLPDAPPEPPPAESAPFRMWGPDATPRNFYVGFFLGLGGRNLAAANESESTSSNEFTGQFDVRGGIFVDIYDYIRVDVSGRAGGGGVNTDVYEDRYQIPDLSSAVFGVEGGIRAFPWQWGAVAPYFGVQGGYARAEAQLVEPTGVTRCETDEDSTVCEDETEVTFSAGWSGRSVQALGGIRLSRYPDYPFEVTFEAAHTWTSWHRYTVTDGGSFNVRSGQRPATRHWGGILQFAIRL